MKQEPWTWGLNWWTSATSYCWKKVWFSQSFRITQFLNKFLLCTSSASNNYAMSLQHALYCWVWNGCHENPRPWFNAIKRVGCSLKVKRETFPHLEELKYLRILFMGWEWWEKKKLSFQTTLFISILFSHKVVSTDGRMRFLPEFLHGLTLHGSSNVCVHVMSCMYSGYLPLPENESLGFSSLHDGNGLLLPCTQWFWHTVNIK